MIRYVSSSGKTFSFNSNRIRVLTGSFHESGYTPSVTEHIIGASINNMKRGPITYKATLIVSGPIAERKALLNSLHDSFDMDVFKNETGTLIINGWCINCFVTAIKTYPNGTGDKTLNDVSFYCPYPYWYIEKTIAFKSEDYSNNYGFDFPYDYKFDFCPPQMFVSQLSAEGYRDCNFLLHIDGPVNNPVVTIDNYPYEVTTEIESGEYIEIDSLNRTVYKYKKNGITENLFNSRRFDISVFKTIEPGKHTLSTSSQFSGSITLRIERSEPKWS